MTKLLNLFIQNKLLMTVLIFFAGTTAALAGVGGEFDEVYQRVVELAQGDLGKIATALVFCYAGYSVYNQNFLMAGAAIVFAIVLNGLDAIVSGFFDATIVASDVLTKTAPALL